jgi:hypothetical protein
MLAKLCVVCLLSERRARFAAKQFYFHHAEPEDETQTHFADLTRSLRRLLFRLDPIGGETTDWPPPPSAAPKRRQTDGHANKRA